MTNINAVINDFYDIFYSYRKTIGIFSFWTWLFTGFGALSVLATLQLVGLLELTEQLSNKKLSFILFIFSFVATMACGLRINYLRDQRAINSCKDSLKVKTESLVKLKVLWLKRRLPYERSEYISLVENIDKTAMYRDKYQDLMDFNLKGVGEYVFASESKPRILAMFLMLCATVATLSVKDGATISSVFKFYDTATLKDFITIFVYFPLAAFIGYLEIKLGVIILGRLVERFFERWNGKNAFSERRTKIFINELIRLYSFKKPRVSATA